MDGDTEKLTDKIADAEVPQQNKSSYTEDAVAMNKIMKEINAVTDLQQKNKKPTNTPIKTQSQFYSNREKAIENAKLYSNYVRQDVFVCESTYGNNEHQYTLRIMSEIFSPDSDCVIWREEYMLLKKAE